MPRLVVGSVPYLVGRPLDQGLEAVEGLELVRLPPAELVRGLRAGELDVALSSSIELFRREGYRYVDGPVVAGHGPVSSVRVFLRRPLRELRTIALDPASRTAATLVRVLLERASPLALEEAPRETPRFLELEPGRDPRAAEADAWLRIGDHALAEALAAGAPPAFDPAAAWTERTGLPFVFAAWIVRPGAPIEPFLGAFAPARTLGPRARERLAAGAARELGLPEEALVRYLVEECRYDLGARLRPALVAFRDAAAALGLARADLAPEPLSAAEHVA
jgi:predicted solute-binding protein